MTTPYHADPDVTIYHGDALAMLRELPGESAHMAVTSPPFLGLRDYGLGDDGIGLEYCADEENWPTVPAVVLDPFLGSGTTAIAARRLGRHCVGIDLSADYCEMAARRLGQLTLAAGAIEGRT